MIDRQHQIRVIVARRDYIVAVVRYAGGNGAARDAVALQRADGNAAAAPVALHHTQLGIDGVRRKQAVAHRHLLNGVPCYNLIRHHLDHVCGAVYGQCQIRRRNIAKMHGVQHRLGHGGGAQALKPLRHRAPILINGIYSHLL